MVDLVKVDVDVGSDDETCMLRGVTLMSPHAADFLADMSLPLIPNSAIAAVLPVLTFSLTHTVPRPITPYENAWVHAFCQEVMELVSEQPKLLLLSHQNLFHL